MVLFALLWITSPGDLPPLLHEPLGQKLIAFALVMLVLGVLWMRKIIHIDM